MGGDLKLILGKGGDSRIVAWPKAVGHAIPFGQSGGFRESNHQNPNKYDCRAPAMKHEKGDDGDGADCRKGCLFNVTADPSESHNLYKKSHYKSAISEMKKRLKKAAAAAPPRSQYYSDDEHKHRDKAEEGICENLDLIGFVEPYQFSKTVFASAF